MNMENTTRKTAKYYRTILCGSDLSKAISVIPEVFKKFHFVGKYRTEASFGWSVVSKNFNWNHGIAGFYLGRDDNRVYVDVYWQGDSTDGNASLLASSLVWGSKRIPAEYSDGYCRHGVLDVTTQELIDALKALADCLTPESTKERKHARLCEKYSDVLNKRLSRLILNPIYDNRYYGLGYCDKMEKYRNGEGAVRWLAYTDPKKFAEMTEDEFKTIFRKVFEQNEKYNKDIKKEGDKTIYDLSY